MSNSIERVDGSPGERVTNVYVDAVLQMLVDFGVDAARLPEAQTTLLHILADLGEEKHRLEATEKAVLNILEDFGGEKQRLEDMQRAVLNILEDLDTEKRTAQEASRMKSEFLANMSHELRTPLNAIMGFTKLMAHGKVGPVSARQHEFLGDIIKSSNHLLQLINDVLDLAKVEAGKMEFHPEPVDLAKVVDEVQHVLAALAATRQIQIVAEVDALCTGLVLDTGKLKQVLYNYLSNAIKFSGEGGRVIIRARPEGTEFFRLEVQDNGIGIRPEDVKKLFSKFRQLDSSAAKMYQGTGLGLALTKQTVEAQGGSVGVESVVGRGSRFFAVLPRRPQASVSQESA